MEELVAKVAILVGAAMVLSAMVVSIGPLIVEAARLRFLPPGRRDLAFDIEANGRTISLRVKRSDLQDPERIHLAVAALKEAEAELLRGR